MLSKFFEAVAKMWRAVFGSEPLIAVNVLVTGGYAIYREVVAEVNGQTGAVVLAVAVATVLARRLVTPTSKEAATP